MGSPAWGQPPWINVRSGRIRKHDVPSEITDVNDVREQRHPSLFDCIRGCIDAVNRQLDLPHVPGGMEHVAIRGTDATY